MGDQAETPDPGGAGGVQSGGTPDTLVVARRMVPDIKTIGRAFRERWPMPDELRRELLQVLRGIALCDTFEVQTEEAPVVLLGRSHKEGEAPAIEKDAPLILTRRAKMPNHRNQTAAAKVLLAATAQDQGDQHHLEKIEAGKEESKTPGDVRILIVDGRGSEQPVSLREFYTRAPATLPAANPDPQRPGPEQVPEGGAKGE